ncbi:MAG: polymer-forming cytoskeletal protein [Candidatus Omnitrophica bacterium]|nr:polymer-forming cytoskeletal protein [Candidatus Omnitrophota bacterium]
MGLRPRRDDKNNASEEMGRNIEINAEMQGNLVFKDPVNLKINGKFIGSLDTHGSLAIGETSEVDANIISDNVIIAGKVTGDVLAHKMLVLLPTAVVLGNIVSPKVNIVEGAIFNGKCQMVEGLLSMEEVAHYLEIDGEEIERMANTGEIPGIKSGRAWLFEKQKIEIWAGSAKVA